MCDWHRACSTDGESLGGIPGRVGLDAVSLQVRRVVGAGCKSDGSAYRGSNPLPATARQSAPDLRKRRLGALLAGPVLAGFRHFGENALTCGDAVFVVCKAIALGECWGKFGPRFGVPRLRCLQLQGDSRAWVAVRAENQSVGVRGSWPEDLRGARPRLVNSPAAKPLLVRPDRVWS